MLLLIRRLNSEKRKCLHIERRKGSHKLKHSISNIIREAIASAGLPRDCVQLIDDTSRESANALMRLNGYVDVLILRGWLIEAVCKNSTVPVIETGAGTCHIYVVGRRC